MKKTRPAKAEEITARLNAVRQTESSELDPLLIGCNVLEPEKWQAPLQHTGKCQTLPCLAGTRVTLVSSPILH